MNRQNPFTSNNCCCNNCYTCCYCPYCCKKRCINQQQTRSLCSCEATTPVIPPITPPNSLGYADFYALMPPDNGATVAPGADVSFPRSNSASSGTISRISPSSFNLGPIGTYQVFFQVSVDEAGQLLVTLNGQDLEYTVAGRATGTSQIVGMAIITTTAENSVLTVRNPAGNATALTITPLAGGTRPVSAHLVIVQIR